MGTLTQVVNPNRMRNVKPGISGKWNRSAFALFLLLASCLFETTDQVRDADPDKPGYLNLELRLKPNNNALIKAASADTTFNLDSVIVVLSSSDTNIAATRYSYPVSGRSDTGNIAVSAKIFTLASLRTWKANIYTIDTTLNPVRKDTVHRDSVSFTIKPGDTAFVSKSVNPAYSILRARLVSNAPGSITNNVKWVRIRVDGITRDSARVGFTFRFAEFGNSSTGYAVGDSGNVVRSTDKGITWIASTSNTAKNLRGVSFPSQNTGFAVGEGGTIIKSTNGTTFAAVTSNTTQDLNAVYFSGASNGWAVGKGGIITKSTNGTSFTAEVSGTTANLNAIHFASATIGNAVGDGGIIRKTTDGGTTWSGQTSNTAQNLNGIFLASTTIAYAVGNGGVILKTTNSGSTWTVQTSNTTANLNEIYCVSATEAYAVGDGGVMVATMNGTAWSARATNTTQNLYGVAWTTNGSGAVAVGDLGAIVSSPDGTAWTLQWNGTKSFDSQLTYKYFTPNVSHSLRLEAMDIESGTLRGYQVIKTLLLAPGKDSTITPNPGLTQCGYASPSPVCTP